MSVMATVHEAVALALSPASVALQKNKTAIYIWKNRPVHEILVLIAYAQNSPLKYHAGASN